MHHDYFVVQRPVSAPAQLFLLFHGVGDNPISMGDLGKWFADSFPQAMVICVGASDSGVHGRQWYSVDDLSEENHQQRVDAVMATFTEIIRDWQRQSGVKAEATALIGFSQGSTMALEAIKAQPGLAGRVIAFSGRYASPPQSVTKRTTIHLIHGDDDEQVPLGHALEAEAQLLALGGDVTLNIVEDLPHAVDQRAMQSALDHLHYTVPRRYFDEALSGSAPGDDDVIPMR
ncbi:esterase [Pantoea sp. MBD-2R]|uniref:esterase n=1 Tax=unclassified Pantoea TaxID=2630326 RepID=UPI0011BDE7FE|nr:esterase [Pantoea sp. CCBC3-3-1]